MIKHVLPILGTNITFKDVRLEIADLAYLFEAIEMIG
ncbi:hypothetical protein D039_2005A, partial [Vibrio parahaemolyticus EKP-028]